MLPVLLAGASAVVWGAADFCGGVASGRGAATLRQRAVTVAMLAHLCAIPMIVPFLFVVPGRPTAAALMWGAAAGLASLVGVIALNLGLASGAMAAVAPVAAVTAALVPLVGGLLLGERPAFAAVVGAAAAVGAIVMVSREQSSHPVTTRQGRGAGKRKAQRRRKSVKRVEPNVLSLALISGVAFGLFFLLLGQAGKEAGMWPLLADKLASVLVGLAVLARIGVAMTRSRIVIALAALSGMFDALGTALYLISAHSGQISVVAPVAALYPASTVVLALIFNKEKLRPIQFAGLGLAGVALVLAAS